MASEYNTYVISTDEFKAVRQIASGVGVYEARDVEARESRKLNSIDHFTQSYEIGSARDKECQRDLKRK